MSHLLRAPVVVLCFLFGCGGAANTAPPPSAAAGGGAGAAPNGAASESGGVTGVTFTKKPQPVGTVSVAREHNESRLDMDVSVDGASPQHSTIVSVETVERRTEVLAAGDDGSITRVKVTYAQSHKEETGKGVVTSAVEGKTYFVAQGQSATSPPVVTDANGPVSPPETALVTADFKHLGRIDPFWRALPSRAINPGESLDDMAKALLDDESSDGLENVTIRFDGARDVGGAQAGVFDVGLTGKLVGEDRSTISGKVALLLSNGWEVQADIGGPLQFSKNGTTKEGKPVTVMAKGTMHLHKETTYGE